MKQRKRTLKANLLACLVLIYLLLSPSALASADSWGIDLPQNISSADNYLFGISDVTSSDVWSVGSYTDYLGTFPLIENWSGSSWSTVSNPSVSSESELYGIDAVESEDIWAVGYQDNSVKARVHAFDSQPTTSGGKTLIEYYNGSSWSVETSPNGTTTGFNNLRGVSALSTEDVWSVGFYYDGDFGKYKTLAVNRDKYGTWSIVSTPNPGTDNLLYSIDCIASDNCWAVGNKDYDTLIMHWSGSSWTTVSSPSPGSNANYLQGVTCSTASDCWAVGTYQNTSGPTKTLTLHYNGTSWSWVSSPNHGTSDSFLMGLAPVESDWVWAVGGYYASPNATLILEWDGSSWSTITSPNESGGNELDSVSVEPGATPCVSGSNWSAGWYDNGGADYTLAESYTYTNCSSP